jgi:hypothetical protein
MPSRTSPQANLSDRLERIEKGLERLHEVMADLQKSMYQVFRRSASKAEAGNTPRAAKRGRKVK